MTFQYDSFKSSVAELVNVSNQAYRFAITKYTNPWNKTVMEMLRAQHVAALSLIAAWQDRDWPAFATQTGVIAAVGHRLDQTLRAHDDSLRANLSQVLEMHEAVKLSCACAAVVDAPADLIGKAVPALVNPRKNAEHLRAMAARRGDAPVSALIAGMTAPKPFFRFFRKGPGQQ